MPETKGMDFSNPKRHPVIGRDGLHYFDNKLDAKIYMYKIQAESDLEFARFWGKCQRKDNVRFILLLVFVLASLGLALCWMIFK